MNMQRTFTIGMAGHIDHGKTTLTKALTNIDTDRLKEEKERQISIELGFAPLYIDENMDISIVDVPGHERFIRQMIAGVAGIDLVLLVVAADEGVMPQTKEHLEILSFLGITHGIVVISKIDHVEADFIELVKEDIREQLLGTVFEESPLVLVDSHSKKGIPQLKEVIKHELQKLDVRNTSGAFRLPIDQVFTIKGHGTVVRGTAYEGNVHQGEILTVLPKRQEVRVRQLQVHHRQTDQALAGQRVAINLSNIGKDDLKRGDVLVSSNTFAVTDMIDVSLHISKELLVPIKQRAEIKCHLGTAEVMGKIIFFDRNEVDEKVDEVLCQLRLHEPIVTKRGDRFIIRRPSPVETIGGGWVIDPNGKKYRYGKKTIAELESKKIGTPKERLLTILHEEKLLSFQEIVKRSSLDNDTILQALKDDDFIEIEKQIFTSGQIMMDLQNQVHSTLTDYHQSFPLRFGLNKAVLLQQLSVGYPKKLAEFVVEEEMKKGQIQKIEQYIQLATFKPHFPEKWAKRMENMLIKIEHDGMAVGNWEEYFKQAGISEKLEEDLKHFLIGMGFIYSLDEKIYIHKVTLEQVLKRLHEQTNDSFELKDAKEILNLSRKYLVPLLELLDRLHFTKRAENKRFWVKC